MKLYAVYDTDEDAIVGIHEKKEILQEYKEQLFATGQEYLKIKKLKKKKRKKLEKDGTLSRMYLTHCYDILIPQSFSTFLQHELTESMKEKIYILELFDTLERSDQIGKKSKRVLQEAKDIIYNYYEKECSNRKTDLDHLREYRDNVAAYTTSIERSNLHEQRV